MDGVGSGGGGRLAVAERAIRGARLADGRVVDVVLGGGRIVAVGQDAAGQAPEVLDAGGGLLLPAFVDTHIHLDKVLIRRALPEHDGTLQGARRPMRPSGTTPSKTYAAGPGRSSRPRCSPAPPGCSRTSTWTPSAGWCR